jgi:hypothetical protein
MPEVSLPWASTAGTSIGNALPIFGGSSEAMPSEINFGP